MAAKPDGAAAMKQSYALELQRAHARVAMKRNFQALLKAAELAQIFQAMLKAAELAQAARKRKRSEEQGDSDTNKGKSKSVYGPGPTPPLCLEAGQLGCTLYHKSKCTTNVHCNLAIKFTRDCSRQVA
jgi:hypothetical protein